MQEKYKFNDKYKIPIDTLSFSFFVIPVDSPEYDTDTTPKDGCYVYGLYLDGARWDNDNLCINESLPKVLYDKLPFLWFYKKKTFF